MRRAILALALGLAFASYALPQEPAAATAEAQGDPMIWWKWANFAILAGGLGYLIGKHVPALFRKQSEEIRKSLADAAKAKKEADAQAAGIQLRLDGIQIEIANLRQDAHTEMTAEGERIRRETERHLERVQEQSRQEIALMTRGAKDELRRYSAALAVDLAQQRIRSSMTASSQESLADAFLQDLRARAASRTSN